MQLIEQFASLPDAQDAALRLRREGILTHISSLNSYVMSGLFTGAVRIGLWSVLDSQYEDACKVLTDPKHIVTTGLSEDELVLIEKNAKKDSFDFFNKLLWYSGLTVLGLIGLASYITFK